MASGKMRSMFALLTLLITQIPIMSSAPPADDPNGDPLCSTSGCDTPELGLPPPDVQFVYRGEEVVQDVFLPWMAFVLGPAICTATIVSRNYVLSAGHCVNAGGGKAYTPESVTVFAGSANLSSASQFDVERITLRSEYADRYDEYIGSVTMGDMALLKLATPLNFTDTLRPIGLSREGASIARGLPEGKQTDVVVAGWGNTKPHCETSTIWKLTHPKIPERLQYGRERVLPTGECVQLEFNWHLEQMAKRNETSAKDGSSPAPPTGWNERELRRRIASKMADKICVISDTEPHAVVESGDSGGPLLVSSSAEGRWSQLGTLTGGPCHGKEAPLHDYYTQIDCEWVAIQTDDEVQCQ